MFGTVGGLFGEMLGNHKKMYVNNPGGFSKPVSQTQVPRAALVQTDSDPHFPRVCVHVCVYLCQNVRLPASRAALKLRVAAGCGRVCPQPQIIGPVSRRADGSQDSPKMWRVYPKRADAHVSCIFKRAGLCSIEFLCYFCMRVDWICGCTCQFVIHVFEGCRAAVALGY